MIFGLGMVGGLLLCDVAEAYVGPGAGFVMVSSFFVFFVTILLALLNLIIWPFRAILKLIKQRKAFAKSMVDRVVVIGFDGMDPDRVNRLFELGKLPHMASLRDEGTYTLLHTTCPSISPVAWSTFATGVNPGKHSIFDFLMPNRKLYIAELSSARIGSPPRTLSLGPIKIPLGKTPLSLLRRSQSFWSILGKHGIFSTILRVPITFPPEKFKGLLLSAMCVPDLRGTQGSFTCYSTEDRDESKPMGGLRIPLQMEKDSFRSYIPGPPSPVAEGDIRIPFSGILDRSNKQLRLKLPDQEVLLKEGAFSPWITLRFKAGPFSKVTGIVLFRLMKTDPALVLYMSPIHIDPHQPAMPISHPMIYSVYMAKKTGTYSTLGLAEDTWALNEGVLDDQAFLEQCMLFHSEREKAFMAALENTRKGTLVCVFDATDRCQHMFMRYSDKQHLAPKDGSVSETILDEIYMEMDKLVGQVRAKLTEKDFLVVMSDHGFKSFRRGFSVNSWLVEHGYMTLEDGKTSAGEWYQGVNWEKTRAYGLGLAGIYLNVKGREAKGCVEPGEQAERLAEEIAAGLTGLRDEETGTLAIKRAYLGKDVFFGPYAKDGPEIVIGYQPGYRTSWDAAVGRAGEPLFVDNLKAWSGDHCMDPHQVPGIILTNRRLDVDHVDMQDLAPTILTLLGIQPPSFMDGSSLVGKNGKDETGI